MQTFINVIFRKILYKIPLKFLLILLAIGALLFASFSNADNITVNSVSNNTACSDCSVNVSTYNSDLVCLVNVGCYNNDFLYNYDHGNSAFHIEGVPTNKLANGLGICSQDVIYYSTNTNCEYMINYINIDINSILEENVDSNYCQNNGYCPIIDSNYCQNNNLCPSYDCPTNTGDLQWSAVYVNNVQHIGGENIFIDIPDTVGWDYYNYNDNFYLSVSGSNFNYEVLDQVKSVQSYVPTTDDFSKIIGGFGPFGALLGAVILVVVVFYLIKKVF